jgi:hypothetical protein
MIPPILGQHITVFQSPRLLSSTRLVGSSPNGISTSGAKTPSSRSALLVAFEAREEKNLKTDIALMIAKMNRLNSKAFLRNRVFMIIKESEM